jgi:Protein of unknown function (DUF3500)
LSRNSIRLLAACAGFTLIASAYYRTTSVSTMTQAAQALLNSLNAEQQAKVKLPFEGDERLFWHYIPTDDIPKRYNKPRMGLILRDMTPGQQHLATALLGAGLSQSGFIKATTIMSLEDVLKVMEKDTVNRRDASKYHFSIFGTPSDTGTWGYRVEGHHVSLHFTIVKGKLSGTPTFFGANPHEVREGPRAGLRPLGREEDLGRTLMQALDASQQKTAVVAEKAYADILTEASRKAALKGQPNGLPVSKMNAKQKALLHELMEEYVSNVPDSIAAQRREQIKKAGANMHFAWAGPVEKGQPHYYRVSSAVFLIEYDNTQNGANHTHTVWRDYEGDFGLDMLGDHIKASH